MAPYHAGASLLSLFLIGFTAELSRSTNIEDFSSPEGGPPGRNAGVCTTVNETLQPGEWRPLPGCKQLTCVSQANGNIIALVFQSCDIEQENIPEGCNIVPSDPELQFPECCKVALACQQVVTKVYPVVYTHENMSSLPRDDSDNLIHDVSQHPLPDQKSLLEERNGELAKNIRTRREIVTKSGHDKHSSNSTKDESGKGPVRCITRKGEIEIGGTMSLKGCSEMRCVADDTGIALIVVSCPPEEVRVPNGCEIVPPVGQNLYPDCCKVVFKCVKKIITVVPILYTSENISQLAGNETENLIMNGDNENGTSDFEPDDLVMESDGDKSELSVKIDVLNDSSKLPVEFNNPNESIISPVQTKNHDLTTLSIETNNSYSTNLPIETSIDEENSNSTRIKRAIGTQTVQPTQRETIFPEGCITSNGTLRANESIPLPGCAELKCILYTKNVYSLVYVSCEISTAGISPDCNLLPKPKEVFPLCCVSHLVCKKVITEVFPVAYTAGNISELHRNDADNLMDSSTSSVPNEMIQMNFTDVDRNDGDSSTISIPEEMVQKHFADVDRNDGNRSTINITEEIVQKNSADIDKSSVSKNVTNIQFIDLDKSQQLPKENITTIHSVDISKNHVQKKSTTNNQFVNKDKVLVDTIRPKREIANTTKYMKGIEEEDVCVTTNGTIIKKGDNVTLEGCSQLQCISEQNGTALALVVCVKKDFTVPENCEIVPRMDSRLFPDCCAVVFRCVVPAVSAASELELNKTVPPVPGDLDNFISIALGSGNQINESSIPEPQHPRREKRGATLRRDSTPEALGNEPQGCMVGNSTLTLGESIPMEGCAQLRCVSSNDTVALIAISCEMPDQESQDGCTFLRRRELEFPECCEEIWVCETNVTETYPAIYTSANISELERNSSENTLNMELIPAKETYPAIYTSANISELERNNSENKLNMELIPAKEDTKTNHPIRAVKFVLNKRQKRSIRSINNSKTVLEKGCSIKNRTLRAGEFIPLEDCSRMECLEREDNFYLVVVSCSTSKHSLPEGCTALPRLKSKYPECCEVDMVCKEVKTFLVPKIYSAANVSFINLSDSSLTGIEKTSFNKDQEPDMATAESQRSRRITTVKHVLKGSDNDTSTSGNKTSASPSLSQMISKRKRQSKTETVPKPSFVLPAKTTSRNRSVNNTKENEQITQKLKDSMFITAIPTVRPEAAIRTGNTTSTKRRRLSSLLSSKNLRNTTQETKQSSAKTQQTNLRPTKLNETQNNKQREERKPAELPKVSTRVQDNNSSDAENVAQRRKIYAHRLNRYRAMAGSVAGTDKPKTDGDKKGSERKREIGNKKNEKKIKDKKEKDVNTKEETKTKESKVPKLKKTSLLKRRLGSRRMIDIDSENDSKVEDKKTEETKNLPLKTRSSAKNKLLKQDGKTDAKTDSGKAEINKNQSIEKPLRKRRRQNKKVKMEKRKKKSEKTKPSFDIKTEEKDKDEKLSRGESVFDSAKLKIAENDKKETSQAAIRSLASSRGRNGRRKLSTDKKDKDKEEKDQKAEKVAETETKQKEIPKMQVKLIETEAPVKTELSEEAMTKTKESDKENEVITDTPDFDSIYNIDYSFPSSFEELDKLYKYPSTDLEISSSDLDNFNSTNNRENEIIDIPDSPKLPLKITTVSFSTSRRSFKTSKTRNTSKNFKDNPTVYKKQEEFKSSTFP